MELLEWRNGKTYIGRPFRAVDVYSGPVERYRHRLTGAFGGMIRPLEERGIFRRLDTPSTRVLEARKRD